MLVKIIQTFDDGSRRWFEGENPDVDKALAARWIAEGKATADTDGTQQPPSGLSAAQVASVARATSGSFGLAAVLAQSAVAIPHTGTTSATQLVSLTIPANSMGANGGYRLTLQTSETNNVNNKTLIVRMSGTAFYQAGDSSKTGRKLILDGWNRGATGSQLHFCTGVGTTLGAHSGTQVTTSFDTTADQTIQVIVTLANAADTFTIEGYRLEVFYGA